MLVLQQEKHLACFDCEGSFYSSYAFTIHQTPADESEKKDETTIAIETLETFFFELKIYHHFTFEWESAYFSCEELGKQNKFGSCPLSLQNYLEYYQDPKIHHFRLSLLPTLSEQAKNNIYGQPIGKIVIKTHFRGNVFKLPINILDKDNKKINIECQKKTVCLVAEKREKQNIICTGSLLGLQEVDEVSQQFVSSHLHPDGYSVQIYSIPERVESENIVVVKGKFKVKELSFDKSIIRIYCPSEKEIFFIEGLMQHLQTLKIVMGEIEELVIFQQVETTIEEGYRTIFYADPTSLYRRIFKSYLFDKIKEQWIVEGMVHFNRSNKHFQDVARELIDLLSEGEELVPLQDDTFCFDRVWKLKAIFFYHILSNFKNLRDYGSSSLASLLIEQSRKKKITSQVMFKRLKNRYGLTNFRTIYEQQFVKSTGLNRIFYEIIDLKRENRVKIIVRQKSLLNKIFRMYNYYRIKLEQEFDLMSSVTAKIINKNNILDKSNRKKEFSGPLAVPKILKCLPYFKGFVSVQTDASEMAFELQLKEENIIEDKQSVTSRIRAPIRKSGESEKAYEGFGWIMIDTAHTFPAVYKNQNVDENVILEKIKRRYDSEHEEIKILNGISSRDHSANQKICKALIDKVKININAKQNCTINVKRKILQILPFFFGKASDFRLWEDLLSFLKLYEPVCHDYSEDGFNFLLSLIESLGQIDYKQQFSFYFEQFHKIMLKILRTNNFDHSEKELKLKRSIFSALMKWKSCFSLEILEEVEIEMKLSQCNVRASLDMLKIIFKHLFPYLKSLKLPYHKTVEAINQLVAFILAHDSTYELFAIKFQFELSQLDQQTQPIQYLKTVFRQLEGFRFQNIRKYYKSLQVFKNSLNNCKKLYALELQLKLKENQSFFIAQYLWKELTSEISCNHHQIRLQWIKIYRIFYYYFVPIVTLRKIKNNQEGRSFKELTPEEGRDVLERLSSFHPDIKWFSGYDSRSAKELKQKYNLMNESRKKKKGEDYTFEQNNIITIFIKEHPGRDTWDELGRKAISIFVTIYEDKEQKSDGKEAEKCKLIQDRFKKVEQKLKRGKMPDSYCYEELKQQIFNIMAEFSEKEEKVTDILTFVDNALKEMAEQKARKEAEQRDEMKIVINFDAIQEEREEEEEDAPNQEEGDKQINENPANEDEGDFQMLFGDQLYEEEQDMELKEQNKGDQDQDDKMIDE